MLLVEFNVETQMEGQDVARMLSGEGEEMRKRQTKCARA